MYTLLAIDTVLRITAAILFLFVAVPALARRRPVELDRLEWFWWCLAAGITFLTIAGQILSLANVHSAATLLLLIVLLVLAIRSKFTGRPATQILQDLYRACVRFSLNALEGRVSVRRRIARMRRRLRASVSRTLATSRWTIPGWVSLVALAATMRLYRPFATANLGFSDTYVHLFLVRLLQDGRQVDPAWGPYPRGMHFLLLAIHELTNVDPILLMNFFGAIVGVLITLAVADAARRLSNNLAAGLLAGALFATMIGGPTQYALFGGSMATDNVNDARAFVRLSYDEVPPTSGEFDVLLTVFQRQTATLPQELAVVLLFPAVMFLRRAAVARRTTPLPNPLPAWRGEWAGWHLSGYLFCTAAIAATHPGVAVPLVLLSGITVIATRTSFKRAITAGAAGIALGSTWMLAYIVYPRFGSPEMDLASATGTASTAMYYFPFLRDGDNARIITYVAITPFLLACLAIAVVLLFRRKEGLLWASLAAIVFALTHVASRFGWPEIIEVRRNAIWLAMAIAILLGVAAVEFARARHAKIVVAAALILWTIRIPMFGVHDKLIDYSGYNATAYAVLEIQRTLEPFTWTLITYGQEYPMVLGKGFHLAAADFLERYDPQQAQLDIPTRYVFIAVEKTPHPFQIDTWKVRFSRDDVERRLQTWCFLYQHHHRDMRVFLDDEHVRVYVIDRAPPTSALRASKS